MDDLITLEEDSLSQDFENRCSTLKVTSRPCASPTNNTYSASLIELPSENSFSDDRPVIYGELIVLGTNGKLPGGNKGRRCSKFTLRKRQLPNGIKPFRQFKSTMNDIPALDHHFVSYTLSRKESYVVEYCKDSHTDMFQIGRSTEKQIDFVVVDTIPGAKSIDECTQKESTISRYAARIVCDRHPPYNARIYAAGFDSRNSIVLGEKAVKWNLSKGYDGLTTNGVLILNPLWYPDYSTAVWREVSVSGDIYTVRKGVGTGPGSNVQKIKTESNVLRDGCLIDLCGTTLLYRAPNAEEFFPMSGQIDIMLHALNDQKPQCPVNLTTLVFSKNPDIQKQTSMPYVYSACGHVHGHHKWGKQAEGMRDCPLCRKRGRFISLVFGLEPAFHIDSSTLSYAFIPCGHCCSEKTALHWSKLPLPVHGSSSGILTYAPICPFCGGTLTDEMIKKLIFSNI